MILIFLVFMSKGILRKVNWMKNESEDIFFLGVVIYRGGYFENKIKFSNGVLGYFVG